ncbi:hypothetical protein, partial [Vibrio vulnificus]
SNINYTKYLLQIVVKNPLLGCNPFGEISFKPQPKARRQYSVKLLLQSPLKLIADFCVKKRSLSANADQLRDK